MLTMCYAKMQKNQRLIELDRLCFLKMRGMIFNEPFAEVKGKKIIRTQVEEWAKDMIRPFIKEEIGQIHRGKKCSLSVTHDMPVLSNLRYHIFISKLLKMSSSVFTSCCRNQVRLVPRDQGWQCHLEWWFALQNSFRFPQIFIKCPFFLLSWNGICIHCNPKH